MKKIQLSLITLLASSSFIMAGGDIQTVTPYEVVDRQISEVEVPTEFPIVLKEAVVKKSIVPPVVIVEEAIVKDAIVESEASVSGIYAGIGIVAARYDTNCGGCSKKEGIDKTAGLMARVGYDFNKYVGVEARGMMSKISDDGGTVKHAGVFVKPMYPVTDELNTYGLVGLAKTTTQGTLRRTDVTGLAMGVGIEYDLSDDKKKDAKYDREFDGMADQEKGLGVFADYERLYYKSGSPDLDALSVGVTYDF
jgi:OOP family OmpA-OmpF porin